MMAKLAAFADVSLSPIHRFVPVRKFPFLNSCAPPKTPEKCPCAPEDGIRKMASLTARNRLFHDIVPDFRDRPAMENRVRFSYALTKRAARLAALLKTRLVKYAHLPHVWWGVSVEDRRHGLPRIDEPRSSPAAVRFLSIEPLLENLGTINLNGIHWVIVGGESGHGARPMDPSWVISIQRQCERLRVPFFFKQWGGVHKKRAGRVLEGRTWDELPQKLRTPTPT